MASSHSTTNSITTINTLGTIDISNGIPLHRAEGLLLVLETPKGRGVFASRDIPGRTIIEVCPVLVLDPIENEKHVKQTELYHYTYNWPIMPPTQPGAIPRKQTNGQRAPIITQALILGLGSMFNHSVPNQNVGWDRDLANKLMTYTTLRDIKAGEELCISYGQRLTFKDTEEMEEEVVIPQGQPGSEDWTEVMDYIDFIG
ncbi:hypothetical protein HYFRA_00009575 [Hymenoscyphus fraxineus]|uniref:SET domain-containing protein n=1 Tax=Hymenoscyphus fraxineus TaxID=746836 RepID=A0A9N9KYY6_9HELO|nr:hypothetical protein HYFRA_00009575 [Hymenoscyphus fraxineus]